jgi:hypothetical protein
MKLFFRFADYIVRPVEDKDRMFIDLTLDRDEYHRDVMTSDFFLKLLPGEAAWAIEDQKGNVLVYFKTQNVARISLIFTQQRDRELNRDVLTKGTEWLAGVLAQNRFHEMLFDTKGRELRIMAKRRLGFRDSPEELVKTLPTPRLPGWLEEVLHHRQQGTQSEG